MISGICSEETGIHTESVIILPEFTSYDFIALSCFFLLWISYTIYTDSSGAKRGNLTGLMEKHRLKWMMSMLERDNRVVDIQVLNSLLRNASFFASTSILIVAGLVTVMGATDKAIAFLTDISFSIATSIQIWELKIFIMIVIFIYAFFKFAWAMRQLNYCSILVGAARPVNNINEEDNELARRAAEIASNAAMHSNRGIRAYYFGLAMLVWFLHPIILIPAGIFIVLVLYRREFYSQTLRSLDL